MASLGNLGEPAPQPFTIGALSDLLMSQSLLPAEPRGYLATGPLAGDPMAGVQRRLVEDESMAPGVGLAASLIGGPALKGIRAYHGSPYKFEKFSSEHIGTGEGAQAYGHGLYFAGNEATALTYKNAPRVTDMDWRIGGTDLTVPAWVARSSKTERGLDEVLDNFRGRVAEARAREAGGDWNAATQVYHTSRIVEALERVKAGAKLEQPGHMYEVNIRANPEQFLDWDRPLKDQPIVETVRAAVPKDLRQPFDANVGHGITGSNAYYNYVPNQSFAIRPAVDRPFGPSSAKTYDEALQLVGGNPSLVRTILNPDKAAASQVLRDAGIPGIKYLDQGSRSGGQGTSNYVVFDDRIIDILKRYGLIGAAATPALLGQDQQ